MFMELARKFGPDTGLSYNTRLIPELENISITMVIDSMRQFYKDDLEQLAQSIVLEMVENSMSSSRKGKISPSVFARIGNYLYQQIRGKISPEPIVIVSRDFSVKEDYFTSRHE